MNKKYPIGTKVRFVFPYEDTDKIGIIVGYHGSNPIIYIPTADKHIERNQHPILDDGTPFTWYCRWQDIEILVEKNQQLLFAFMY